MIESAERLEKNPLTRRCDFTWQTECVAAVSNHFHFIITPLTAGSGIMRTFPDLLHSWHPSTMSDFTLDGILCLGMLATNQNWPCMLHICSDT